MILDIDKRQEILCENIQGFFFLSVNKLEMFKYLEIRGIYSLLFRRDSETFKNNCEDVKSKHPQQPLPHTAHQYMWFGIYVLLK